MKNIEKRKLAVKDNFAIFLRISFSLEDTKRFHRRSQVDFKPAILSLLGRIDEWCGVDKFWNVGKKKTHVFWKEEEEEKKKGKRRCNFYVQEENIFENAKASILGLYMCSMSGKTYLHFKCSPEREILWN